MNDKAENERATALWWTQAEANELAEALAAKRERLEAVEAELGRLREVADEFLNAYIDSDRTIPADQLERLDEAEDELRAALSSPGR